MPSMNNPVMSSSSIDSKCRVNENSEIDYLLAKLLIETKSLLVGEFKLTSGLKSPIYIDARRLLSHPKTFKIILTLLASRVAEIIERGEVDLIVGIATAGIAWATGLALWYNLPLAYVRPEPKKHGMSRQVEGLVEGHNALIVDDVATTGSSILKAVEALRKENCKVMYAVVIVDRCQGASERLALQGIKLLSLTTLPCILRVLEEKQLLPKHIIDKVRKDLYGGNNE